MTKCVDEEKRFVADKDDDDDDDEGLPFKMIVGDLAVWTPREYRGVSCRPHRNPIFG